MKSLLLIPTLLFGLAACSTPELADSQVERKPLGKGDAVGSCDLGNNGNACGGPAAVGNCWCDDLCEDYGDCCSDKAIVCDDDPNFCEDFVPPCSSDSECGDGFVCDTSATSCSPSACGCDPTDGSIFCTADCSGKECIPVEVDLCEDFVPPCSSDSECGDGFVCDTSATSCSPSACGCDPTDGSIFCTADCSGKECIPAEINLCEDFQPPCSNDSDCGDGSTCVFDPTTCSSSGCGCDPTTGSILCTADCGGGECV